MPLLRSTLVQFLLNIDTSRPHGSEARALARLSCFSFSICSRPFYFLLTVFHDTFFPLVGIPKVARSRLTQCSKSCDLQPIPHCSVHAVRGAQGALPMRVGGAASQLDLPALTPLSVAALWSTATRSSPLGYFSNYCK